MEKRGQAGAGQCRVTRLIMIFMPKSYACGFEHVGRIHSMLPTGAEGGGGGPFMGRRRSKRCLLHVGTSCKLAAIHDVCLAGAWQIGGLRQGLGVRGIPCHTYMGWIQAVSLFQHLHRQLGMALEPRGAGQWMSLRSLI